jgi:hypothetical protein
MVKPTTGKPVMVKPTTGRPVSNKKITVTLERGCKRDRWKPVGR